MSISHSLQKFVNAVQLNITEYFLFCLGKIEHLMWILSPLVVERKFYLISAEEMTSLLTISK